MNAGDAIVYIVDDDASLREALVDLTSSVGLRAVAFRSPKEFLAHPRADVPSCLVLDVRLPGQSGLDFQRSLAESGVDLPVVFITGHGDVPMSVQAMKAGAVEFLLKPFRDQDLLDSVQAAIERDRARRSHSAQARDMHERFASLTPREREVLAFVVAGRPNKQIAADLGLSEVTVKVHRGQIMKKMRARSLPELVRMADPLLGTSEKS